MAHIALQMTAIADERCTGCGRPFERGETMHAIEYEDGEKAGWYCQTCVDYWRANGRPREVQA